MAAFAKAEDAGLKSGLLELTAIVPHSLAGWFAVVMCAVFVVELVTVVTHAALPFSTSCNSDDVDQTSLHRGSAVRGSSTEAPSLAIPGQEVAQSCGGERQSRLRVLSTP
jgi:hypothetical protein